MRGLGGFGIVAADVAVAEVVGEDDDEIGLGGGGSNYRLVF